jgi:hypothetical protein
VVRVRVPSRFISRRCQRGRRHNHQRRPISLVRVADPRGRVLGKWTSGRTSPSPSWPGQHDEGGPGAAPVHRGEEVPSPHRAQGRSRSPLLLSSVRISWIASLVSKETAQAPGAAGEPKGSSRCEWIRWEWSWWPRIQCVGGDDRGVAERFVIASDSGVRNGNGGMDCWVAFVAAIFVWLGAARSSDACSRAS